MRYSSDDLYTGIEYHKNEMELSPAIIFDDNTCPFCGEKMERITIQSFDTVSTIRFECKHCWYYSPIRHLTENLSIPLPLYDNSISKFIEEFGEDIHARIGKAIEKTVDIMRY